MILLSNLTSFASESKWIHDLSYDGIQVWKNGQKRLTVEVRNKKNKLEQYNKVKIEQYLKKRDELLKYADFTNFKTQDLKISTKKDYVKIVKLGSYTNSRGKIIYYREIHHLQKNKSFITMFTSESSLTRLDINEMDGKFKYVMEQEQ